MGKRGEKVKLQVMKIPPGLCFTESLGRADSVYVKKLQEALNTGGVVQISKGDSYMRAQLRTAAKKMKAKLVWAQQGDYEYAKPKVVEGEQQRIMLFLREPRSLSELEGKKFELHLANTLGDLSREGLARVQKEKWSLTEKGIALL
jgi:hypothetical protein